MTGPYRHRPRTIFAALAVAPLLGGGAPNPELRPLPCGPGGPLAPAAQHYCRAGRQYVTTHAHRALLSAAAAVAEAHPGSVLRYMDASWARGRRPMPPHLSHGDGRQVDIALFFETSEGRPLANSPAPGGYGAFEPPRRERDRVCRGVSGPHDRPDPSRTRRWRMDRERTRALVEKLAAERCVRRIFLEPHLKRELRLTGEPKIRFAGCRAARHDDHIHVDFCSGAAS